MKIKPFVGWWIDCHLLALFWSAGQIAGLHSKHTRMMLYHLCLDVWVSGKEFVNLGLCEDLSLFVHQTNTDDFIMKKQWSSHNYYLYSRQTFFTLQYNNNTHSNALCTNWHIVKRAVYQGRKENYMILVSCEISQKLPIIKWKKSQTSCRLLTCLYLLRRLNPQQELIPKQEVFCLGEQRDQRLVIPWLFCMFIQNIAGSFLKWSM